MLASPPDLWGQDCIDFERIDDLLDELPVICECSDPIQLGEEGKTTYISEYSLPTVQVEKCFEVFGTLVLDIGMTFEDCYFVMDDGALIRIINDGANETTFRGCHFQSCGENLWDGIELDNATMIYFINNVVQHSLNGIHSKIESSFISWVYIFDNVFSDNRTAINIGRIDPNQRKTQLTILGNLFSQPNDLKSHWDTGPLQGFSSLSNGVIARQVDLISDASTDPCNLNNIFYRVNKGFDLTNASAVIYSNLFYDFRNNLNPGTGITIRSIGNQFSILNQAGWNTGPIIPSFKNVPFPIVTHLTHTSITNNVIDNARDAIRAVRPVVTCFIANNTIAADASGIRVQNSAAENFEIYSNHITIEDNQLFQLPSYGIEVSHWFFKPGSPSIIRANDVILNPGNIGILLVNEVHSSLTCNIVEISDPARPFASGIEIRGGGFNFLRENIVDGLYSSSYGVDQINGIRLVESPHNHLMGNEVSGTELGFHFAGLSINTTQDRNIFGDHDIGYYIGPQSSTGNQWWPANRWLGTYSLWGALNDAGLLFLPTSTYIEYDNFYSSPRECAPETFFPPGFFLAFYPPIGVCGIPVPNECTLTDIIEVEGVTYLDSIIAREELIFSDFHERRNWQAERYLYRNLSSNHSLIPSGSLMDTFYTDAQSGSIEAFHEQNLALAAYFSIPGSLSEEIKEADSLINSLWDSINSFTYSFFPEMDSVELLTEIKNVLEEIENIFDQVLVAFSQWKDSTNQNIVGQLNSIQALSTPNQYAANEKLILEAIATSFGSIDSLPNNMLDSLKHLASQCVFEMGPSVFSAYSILSELQEEIFSDEIYCEEPDNLRVLDNRRGFQNQFLTIYPNPASETVTVEFSESLKVDSKFEIFDVSGKSLLTGAIPKDTHNYTVNLTDLPKGMFLLKVSSGPDIFTSTFLIAH